MLPADHRLRDGAAFRRVTRAGRRFGSPALVVHVVDTAEQRPARVGLVVSRAVGNAVVRNRVKRRLRHLARGLLADLPAGSDVVIRALPAAATLSSSELRDQLTRSLTRAGHSRRAVPTKAGS